jgi:MFS family permease
MVQTLFSRLRAAGIDPRLLILLMINGVLGQTVIALGRVTTSYRALELGLSVVWVGAIATVFALFPIAIAIRVGRYIDRGNDAVAAWIGSGLIAGACAGLVFSASPLTLFVWTAVLGIGHLFLMSSQQMLCVRCAGRHRMEQVVGNYMVAGAIGQGLGPFVVGWAGGEATIPPTRFLFMVALGFAVASLAVSLLMRRSPESRQKAVAQDVVPVRALIGTPGLKAVLLASVLLVTATDLLVIYLPVLGAERSIDVKDIGVLLTVRALASMVARAFFARMIMAFGRVPLLLASIAMASVAVLCLALPLPLWVLYIAIAASGFALGVGTVLGVTFVVDLTPAHAHGTANSLRIIGNRIGQVSMPFGAGLVAAATGVGGILVIMAASLAASGIAVKLTKVGRPNEPVA